MANVFDHVTGELGDILTTHLKNPGTVQEIYDYRVVDLDVSPVLIISVLSGGYDPEDMADIVDIGIVTAAKYSGNSEAEAAEMVLNAVEGTLNDLFRGDGGTYQVHPPYWGSVDFYQPSDRPPSPLGPGTRYAIKFMRFKAYGVN